MGWSSKSPGTENSVEVWPPRHSHQTRAAMPCDLLFLHLHIFVLRILVGGWTNPFEKYARQIGHLPQIGMKIKNIWNHHLALNWLIDLIDHFGRGVIKKIDAPPKLKMESLKMMESPRGTSFFWGLLFRFHVKFQGCSSSGVIFGVGLFKTELKVQSHQKNNKSLST